MYVVFSSANANTQRFSYLQIRSTLGHQSQHFPFTVSQTLQSLKHICMFHQYATGHNTP